ncbi:MAG: DUF4387 domain-containing protein [Sphaerobacter sp.]|nr:DUF4387 domain-containing protein [Sphaerobacter sp.]
MTETSGTTMKLRDLATTIRSKNAGVDHITFDIIFREPRYYEAAKRSEALTPQRIADLYRIPVTDIVSFVAFDPAQAIKFTIRRRRPSGSPGEPDVFGSQMYPPLFDIEIPVEDAG